MSGTSKSSAGSTDSATTKWAALDKTNERIVDAAHPLLIELRRERSDREDLPAAS